MFQFKIKPIDGSEPPFDFVDEDASRVLTVVQRMKCHEADVDRDGQYAFSIRLDDVGVWSVFERHGISAACPDPV